MTMQSDVIPDVAQSDRDAVLVAYMRDLTDSHLRLESSAQGPKMKAVFADEAAITKAVADRLESLSRQLSDAQRENERLEDMAAVGESLLEAIADNSEGPPLENWAPADGPAEVVVDLLNWLADAQRERDDLRAAVSEWLRYRNSMLSGDCDTQAGEYAAVKKLESMVKHTEGGKP